MEVKPKDDSLRESRNGCVRIRLHEYETKQRTKRYGIEVSAWNSWAGQAKLLFFAGGFSLQQAEAGFAELANAIRDYDWIEDEFLLVERMT